jgi:alkanesulfonate monooxygenase SsuD/methylene tetrahydromethanopterin reductase-like flavin-dependent oxidoreductase (luciferase family)
MPSSLPQTGIILPDRDGWTASDIVAFGDDASKRGIKSLWCWDGWSYDPFSLLARLSERTDCALGTGIANVYARSPATLAMNALSLDEATNGRFLLGVGASTPPIIEGLHGAAFDRPLRRVRETIEIVRLALSGDEIEYGGDFFDLSGFSLDNAEEVDVPILNAALGETNVAMTLEHADGFMPNLLPLSAINDALEQAESRTGVEADDLIVAPVVPIVVSEDHETARSTLAKHLAFYIGATESYNSVVARHGFEDVADAVSERWGNGEYSQASDRITDELMDAVGIVGTPERAREQLAALPDAIDVPLFEFPDGSTRSMIDAGVEVVSTYDWA